MRAKKGFTLIELLVVVLIIGVLASVALPQYQKAVEKSRMVEAIINLRAIANANERYFLANGSYCNIQDIDLLDIDIPGTRITWNGASNRILSKHFLYSPGNGEDNIAIAQRDPVLENNTASYRMYIPLDEAKKIRCQNGVNASAVQKQLCNQLNTNGSL